MLLVQATFLITTFLVAAVPFGLVLTSMLTDMDIRTAGSGNIGATNVYRLAGRRMGVATLACDILKGFVPALLSLWLFDGALGVSLTILAAFLGHCYSPYLAFRGGKGVATGVGGFLAAAPLAALLATIAWIGVVAFTRKSSLGALVGLGAMIAALTLFASTRALLPGAAVMGLLLLWRHRSNIVRLLSGTESRV
jgi:acyl phosphate:glycerol-3-phosphate acyltransferase